MNLNKHTLKIVQELIDCSEYFNVKVFKIEDVTVIDTGITTFTGFEVIKFL